MKKIVYCDPHMQPAYDSRMPALVPDHFTRLTRKTASDILEPTITVIVHMGSLLILAEGGAL